MSENKGKNRTKLASLLQTAAVGLVAGLGMAIANLSTGGDLTKTFALQSALIGSGFSYICAILRELSRKVDKLQSTIAKNQELKKFTTVQKFYNEDDHDSEIKDHLVQKEADGKLLNDIYVTSYTGSLSINPSITKVENFSRMCRLIGFHKMHALEIDLYFEEEDMYEAELVARYVTLIRACGDEAEQRMIKPYKLPIRPEKDIIIIDEFYVEAHRGVEIECPHIYVHYLDNEIAENARKRSGVKHEQQTIHTKVAINNEVAGRAWQKASELYIQNERVQKNEISYFLPKDSI